MGYKRNYKENRKYFELNKNTTYQTLWYVAKEVLKGKFIAPRVEIYLMSILERFNDK